MPVPVRATHAKRNYFAFKEDFGVYRQNVAKHFRSFGRVSWQTFTESDDFRVNIVDALSVDDARSTLGYDRETHHKQTTRLDHAQIIGRTGSPLERVGSGALLEDFLAGRGFDFIPCVTPRATHGTKVARTHPGILEIVASARHGIPNNGVTFVGDALGSELLRHVFTTADTLVFGRVDWIARTRFIDARTPAAAARP